MINERSLVHSADIIFIYQRMLPYHCARFQALSLAFSSVGKTCVALEVSSSDSSYGDLRDSDQAERNQRSFLKICLFPEVSYLQLRPAQVAGAVERVLNTLKPSVVFSPAPAFSEGAGAMHYRIGNAVKWILMDDAWAATDHRSWLNRFVKKQFYRYIDGCFIPSPLHGTYFSSLNVPKHIQRYSVDVVADEAELDSESGAPFSSLRYLLFVGRLIERKGLDVVLKAFARLQEHDVKLVVIGDGPKSESWRLLANELGLADRVLWLGRRSNGETRKLMRSAQALLVPSIHEQWGLVVNEAWQSGIPVLGSSDVGALQATRSPRIDWMLIRFGDIVGWEVALLKVMSLPKAERDWLISEGKRFANFYSIENHVRSALELANLPQRCRTNPLIGLVARFWQGKVAIW